MVAAVAPAIRRSSKNDWIASLRDDSVELGAVVSEIEPFPKAITERFLLCALSISRGTCGRIAQLVEHLPYKEGVTGSSPVSPKKAYRYWLRLPSSARRAWN